MKKKKFRKAVLAYIKSQMKPDEYAKAVGDERFYALEQKTETLNGIIEHLWKDYRTRQRENRNCPSSDNNPLED